MSTLLCVGLRTVAIAVALFALGCDQSSENAPAEGSCQAMVDELLDVEECEAGLGLRDVDPNVEISARCAAEFLGLEEPPSDSQSGEAYQVAYQALCDIHGNGDGITGYCDTAATLGCEG